MKHSIFLFLATFMFASTLYGQDKPIDLGEVLIVADTKLEDFSNTQETTILTDSIIRKSKPSLTNLLNTNTTIYFKENGAGMVSSPSFRGTTAQQTAVVWNGININSQLNGQTDFNTINPTVFDELTVRSGGGSVLYGSGAIGGTIHLTNTLSYKKGFRNSVSLDYGSFDTYGVTYTGEVATNTFSTKIAVNRSGSENDFEYVEKEGKNLNGSFYNTSVNTTIGYKIDEDNTLTLYNYVYDGERHFSLIFPSELPTKYKDFNTRNLLEWKGNFTDFTSKLKLAYLTEEYKYFPNIEKPDFSTANVESFVAKYDAGFTISEDIRVNGVLDFTQNKGEGTNIQQETRNITAFNLLLKHNVSNRFLYEITTRKEITNTYESQFLYSAGASFRATDFYTIKVNTSKNFRIPTFNDLYWQGSGNPDLKPETSYQAELGNHFNFQNFEVGVTTYYNAIQDMIRWLPNGSAWMPVNTDRVKIYGLESQLGWSHTIGKHHFSANATYAYTVSKNDKTDKQLIYVPYHKGTATLGYALDRFSAYYQFLYVGEVFTNSDNDPKFNVDAYNLSTVGLDYSFGKNKNHTLGFTVRNLLNTAYESVASRAMPGRNYNLHINLNF